MFHLLDTARIHNFLFLISQHNCSSDSRQRAHWQDMPADLPFVFEKKGKVPDEVAIKCKTITHYSAFWMLWVTFYS